ncbi:hypothetical protein CPB83DRAFT_879095 [Crepidotus variabilis]|uniref:Uncharacterized protein n=1 Tax=Crepidotus variabilis TaxID=179855 RepID=A0A9P6ETY4_9AGAR|nr:hypothetical protein CPB83DRAFT_879095 [Crepidotus variabilis]
MVKWRGQLLALPVHDLAQQLFRPIFTTAWPPRKLASNPSEPMMKILPQVYNQLPLHQLLKPHEKRPPGKAENDREGYRRKPERHGDMTLLGDRYLKIWRIIDPTGMPSRAFRKLTKALSRSQTSILARVRTRHVPLQAYLHRIHKEDSPIYQLCQREAESMEHYLKRCLSFQWARRKLRRRLGGFREVDVDLLGKPEHIRDLLRYIAETRRFEDSHANLKEIPHRRGRAQ